MFNSSITLAKPRGEQAGLIIERSGRGVVPNDVIGARNLGREVELRAYHPLNQPVRKPSLQPQAFPLGRSRAGHDDDPIDVRLPAGLVKKRNISVKPRAGTLTSFRPGGPPFANERVKNGLELKARAVVVEDELAQSRPIERAVCAEDGRAERVSQCGMHPGIRGEQFVDAAVCVEVFRGRMLQQRTDER